MKNEIWKQFELTGKVEAYLDYKSNIDNEEENNNSYTSIVETPITE